MMRSPVSTILAARRLPVLWAFLLVGLAALPPLLRADAASSQPTFASPEEAMHALIDAAKTGRPRAVTKLFGSDGTQLLSGDRVQDRSELAQFSSSLQASARLEKNGAAYTLLVGDNRWPFPIPIVSRDGGWLFDTQAGLKEILDRRIGQNELAAIATCRAYAVAQWEYYTESGGDTQSLAVYAQKLFSTPGHRDGLYWDTGDGEKPSPLGALVAEARAEGYGARSGKEQRGNAQQGSQEAQEGGQEQGGSKQQRKPRPFHGYIFKILTAQGSSAPGGKFSYVINGNMIAGFALVAYPAKWGSSGVMTFIINQQGRVYQKNLGPDTAEKAAAMTAYDPDASWQMVEQ
jgi:hypothetical protein